jgi:hypothetical protein
MGEWANEDRKPKRRTGLGSHPAVCRMRARTRAKGLHEVVTLFESVTVQVGLFPIELACPCHGVLAEEAGRSSA